jgi:hypothetical protein
MRSKISKVLTLLLVTAIVLGMAPILGIAPIIRASPPAPPAFWVVPETETFNATNASVGTQFNVTVWVATTVAKSTAWNVKLAFNATQLQAVAAGRTGGATSGWFIGHSTFPTDFIIDNTTGFVYTAETLFGTDFVGPSSGSLFYVTFQINATPTAGTTLTSLIDTATYAPGDTYVLDDTGATETPFATGHCTYSFSSGAPTKPQVTFTQAGLDGTASGTVVTINGTAKTYGQLPNITSVNSGDTLVFSYQTNVSSSVSGKQFVSTGVDATSPLTVSNSETITGSYKTQYQVSFAVSPSGAGTTTPSGTNLWEDSGSLSISATPNSGYTFSNWTTSGSITIANPSAVSTTATVSSEGTITANFVPGTGYSVTFTETGLPSSTSWNVTFNSVLNSSTSNTITFTGVPAGTYSWSVSTPIPGATGTQYLTSSASGTMSVPSQTSQSITYKTQYYLTLATSPPSVNTPTGQGWYDAGSSAPISTDQNVDIVPGSSRYSFNGWTTSNMTEITNSNSPSTTVTIDGAKTVTANYLTQYNVTFSQTGVGSDFTGTVVTIDSSNYTVSTLPAQFWYDNDSTHSFAFQSPLVGSSKQYNWTSTNGLSTLQSSSITVTGPGSVTGNYISPTTKGNPLYDIRGDGLVDIVDIKDINLAAKAFGSRPGDPRWEMDPINGIPLGQRADVNHDGEVTIMDIALIAQQFGKLD